MKIRNLLMKWTMKAVLIGLLFGVAGMMKSFAQTFTVGNLNYSINSDGNSVTVTGHVNGTSATGSLTIPSSVTYESTTYSVTAIGDNAFMNCWDLNGYLYIPYTVTTIGNNAFKDCYKLIGSLTLNSVVTIGNYAFSGCEKLTGQLTLSNSLVSIGDSAFAWCGFTYSLTLPNALNTIGEYAFNGCSGFSGSLSIPNSVTSIGKGAFAGCSGFTGSLTLSNSVSSINDDTFNNCYGFTGTLTIPSSVISIGRMAFFACFGFTGSLAIPSSVTTIGKEAFNSCSGITAITIPEATTTIGENAFKGTGWFYNQSGIVYLNGWCLGSKYTLSGSLTIRSGTKRIADGAFRNYGGIVSVIIPNTIVSIGSSVFYGCSSLNSVTMLATTVPSLGTNVFTNSTYIYVPYESLSTYKTTTNWNNYASRIYPWLQKSVVGYGESNDKWVFIASPLAENTAPITVDNMITETEYDLYRFNQSAAMEWQNYKTHTSDFVLANGQGYLYANAVDVNLIFKGTFNENETEEIGLIYDAGNPCAGWNLIGNPFPIQAYANRSYYVLNEDGTGIEPVAVSSEVAIEPCTGVMVKVEASETNPKVTFSKTAPDSQGNQGVLQIAVAQNNTRGNAVQDKAIVSFNEGDALGKFVFNEDNAKIWIPRGNEDFAIVCAESTSEMPLNFKAKENGAYTISVNPESVEMEYLHLIDNLTGTDVDLLQTPEYTFDSKKSDYASRFKLVFAANEEDGPSTGSETFAFYNGNEWVINNTGEATLQIVDMTGRVMSSEPINGNATMNLNQMPGVYMLRLINGDSVKVQKVVVR